MRRRDLVTLLGGAAAWPLAARAQQPERVRRIGVLPGVGFEAESDAQALHAVFRQALQQLGWTEGRNVRYEYRSRSSGNVDLARRNAAELVALDPDVILVGGATNMEAMQRATLTIPLVFAGLNAQLDEQARDCDHKSSHPCGQAKKQQKVAQEKRHTSASPLSPLCRAMLTRQGNSFRSMPDSGPSRIISCVVVPTLGGTDRDMLHFRLGHIVLPLPRRLEVRLKPKGPAARSQRCRWDGEPEEIGRPDFKNFVKASTLLFHFGVRRAGRIADALNARGISVPVVMPTQCDEGPNTFDDCACH